MHDIFIFQTTVDVYLEQSDGHKVKLQCSDGDKTYMVLIRSNDK